MPILRALVALMMLLPIAAHAKDWPARPIHIIVPYPPGGSTDVAARLVGDALTRALGQQVVVENKTGAGGSLAIRRPRKPRRTDTRSS